MPLIPFKDIDPNRISRHLGQHEPYQAVPGRWPQEKINAWYDALPWLAGTNYYPSTAINQIDMWQASTWDPQTIEKELQWSEDLGFNTHRVYLHDLVWAADEKGLYERMDQFLSMSADHGIRPFFVFFDDCHFPEGKLGPQPPVVPAYHNSGWLTSPNRNGQYCSPDIFRAEGQILKDGEPYPEPALWFHDILREDGSPFDPAETDCIKKCTGKITP